MQIGFELWTMQNDILFDNIYIGHSVEDAAALQKDTFDVKIKAEKAEEEATKPKEDEKPKSPSDLVFKDDPVKYIREKVDLFLTIAKTDPVNAIKFVPEVAGGLGAIILVVVSVLLTLVSNSGSAPSKEQVKGAAKKAKDAAVDAKDKAAEAISTGTEKAQAEVNKRTTRASAQ
jgi:calnexin